MWAGVRVASRLLAWLIRARARLPFEPLDEFIDLSPMPASRADALRARYSLKCACTAARTAHIVAFCAIYAASTMAQTGVSGLVVVDGESFLDALFASAGQG